MFDCICLSFFRMSQHNGTNSSKILVNDYYSAEEAQTHNDTFTRVGTAVSFLYVFSSLILFTRSRTAIRLVFTHLCSSSFLVPNHDWLPAKSQSRYD